MRNELELQAKAKELFFHMFEQRRPTILRDLKCIGAASTLLREQGLRIPTLISLPEIVSFFDEILEMKTELGADDILQLSGKFLSNIKDMRCWIKHFYDQSPIPELIKVKALRRCCTILVQVVSKVWINYKNVDKDNKLEVL